MGHPGATIAVMWRYVLIVAFGMALLTAQAQAPAQSEAAKPLSKRVPGDGSHCAAIAEQDASLAPLVDLCRFANQYRKSLPNFYCEQKTTIRDDDPTSRSQFRDEMTARVTYEDGRETYSAVRRNGKEADDRKLYTPNGTAMQTTGEFAVHLVDLFTAPIVAHFTARPAERVGDARARAFEYSIAQEANDMWRLRDGKGLVLAPAYHGWIWLDQDTNRLVRLEVSPVIEDAAFQIRKGTTLTDYRLVALGEAGTFLLPARSEARVCMRASRFSRERCVRQSVEFSGCRKFAAKSKLVLEAPP